MIPDRMTRPLKVASTSLCLAAAALSIAACGTQKISIPTSDAAAHAGAVLFNQRCGGCHTLSYAATRGSAENVRTAQFNNGPNFDIRCERPVARVLYAIANGGFSGVVMPQNVVVGQQAIDVAQFVAKYAGRRAPKVPGAVVCIAQPIGTIPPPAALANAAGASGTSGPTGANGTTGATAKAHAKAKAKKKP
jgi:mono/diheme cytochrome c family protein